MDPMAGVREVRSSLAARLETNTASKLPPTAASPDAPRYVNAVAHGDGRHLALPAVKRGVVGSKFGLQSRSSHGALLGLGGAHQKVPVVDLRELAGDIVLVRA